MKQIVFYPSGYGHFSVRIVFRNKTYEAVTTNTMAIDRINNTDITDKTHYLGYTRAQAVQTLYNHVKRANGL
jgi:uncharacterized protein YfcZ (UPF0381/DUF406 family)